jgi:PleD family two-component response regulator
MPRRGLPASRALAENEGTMALILLAEDDDSMRSFLAKALERAGHRVRAVADGIDALAALAEEDDIDLTGSSWRGGPRRTGLASGSCSSRDSQPSP